MDTEFDPEIAKARRWLLASRFGLMTESEVVARVDGRIQELDLPPEALLAISMGEDLSRFKELDFVRYPCSSHEAAYLAGLLLEAKATWIENPERLSEVASAVGTQLDSDEGYGEWAWISAEIDMYTDDGRLDLVRETVLPRVFDELERIACR